MMALNPRRAVLVVISGLPGIQPYGFSALCPFLLDDPFDPGHCNPEGVSAHFRQFTEQVARLIKPNVPSDDSADFLIHFRFAFHVGEYKTPTWVCQGICNNSGVGSFFTSAL